MVTSSLQKASGTKIIHSTVQYGQYYRRNRRHLRKDRANITMCQQEVDWEESDSDGGEEEESNMTVTEPTSTTNSRPQPVDEPVMTPSTRQQSHPHQTSTFGHIRKPIRRYIEQTDT